MEFISKCSTLREHAAEADTASAISCKESCLNGKFFERDKNGLCSFYVLSQLKHYRFIAVDKHAVVKHI